jgi:hypothetical protein
MASVQTIFPHAASWYPLRISPLSVCILQAVSALLYIKRKSTVLPPTRVSGSCAGPEHVRLLQDDYLLDIRVLRTEEGIRSDPCVRQYDGRRTGVQRRRGALSFLGSRTACL